MNSYGWLGTYEANNSIYVINLWTTFDNTNGLYLRNREEINGVRSVINITSPGIIVSGVNPVITWKEVAHSEFNPTGSKQSPRNLYISTDGVNFTMVNSYLTSEMPDSYEGDCWRTMEYPLGNYIGQTIWWKWESESVNNEYTYWVIDNVYFGEKTGAAELIHSGNGQFGALIPMETSTRTITFRNSGFGSISINSFEIVGDQVFSLGNEDTFPVQIVGTKGSDGGGCIGFYNLVVSFTPPVSGDYSATLRIQSDNGLLEIPLSGMGTGCDTAIQALLGDNHAPNQNVWFEYTTTKTTILKIHSCHPNQAVNQNPYQYAYDTYLQIYDGCDGNLLAENDDLEWDDCVYNRASAGVSFLADPGKTYKIFWENRWYTPETDFEFTFVVEELPYPGQNCETALPAYLGDNYAPHQDLWYEYTASTYCYLNVTSCHPNQTITNPNEWGWDTFLQIYDGCSGNLIAENDDLKWSGCSYNRAASGATIYAQPGQTFKIFWPFMWWEYYDGFDFTWTIEEIPLPVLVPHLDAVYNVVQVGESVKFLDHSEGVPISWNWTFTGAETTTSNDQNPDGIIYSSPGLYTVSLIVSDGLSTQEIVRNKYILVLDGEFTGNEILTEDFDWSENGIPENWTLEDYSSQNRNWIYTKESLSTPERSYDPAPFNTVDNGFICYPAFVNDYDYNSGQYSYGIHDATIQLPRINFEEYKEVVISFSDIFRWSSYPVAPPVIRIEVSNDLGQTWTPYDLSREIEQYQWSASPFENMSVNITEVAAFSPHVDIRFHWAKANFYYWMIDDMKIKAIPLNSPPTANAGPDLIISATSFFNTEVTLDGSLSSDPDNDILSFTWKESEEILAGPTTEATSQVHLPLGLHQIQLTVDDGNGETSTDELAVTLVDTEPPVIIHPESLILGNDPGLCGAIVDFEVTATDNCDDQVELVCSPPAGTYLPCGTTTVECVASDFSGNITTTSFDVTVMDVEPPILEVRIDPIRLWPANHKLIRIDLDQLVINVSDNCGIAEDGVVIKSVTSDEPEDDKGGSDGNTSDDIIIYGDCRSVDLRAERIGGGNGRVYTIQLSVLDLAGNETTAECFVHVPHSSNVIALINDPSNGYSVVSTCGGDLKTQNNTVSDPLTAQNEINLTCIPNPFRDETILQYTLPKESKVILAIYDINGRKIDVLVNSDEKTGSHQVIWKGLDYTGNVLPSGIYLARLITQDQSLTIRMLLQK